MVLFLSAAGILLTASAPSPHPYCVEAGLLKTNWHTLTNDGTNEWQAGLVTSNHAWVTSDGQVSFTNVHCASNLALAACPMRVLSVLPPLPTPPRPHRP